MYLGKRAPTLFPYKSITKDYQYAYRKLPRIKARRRLAQRLRRLWKRLGY